MSRDTLGKISSDLLTKANETLSPIDIQKATEEEHLKNMEWCIKHARKEVDCSAIDGHNECKNRSALEGDFYVSVLLKKEKLMQNVLRAYFVPTQACPTPHYDQTVYKYNDAKGQVEFLWVVPDQETCEIFRENKNIIVPEERDLLKMVMYYYDGTLFNMMKKLNGETKYAGVALEEK